MNDSEEEYLNGTPLNIHLIAHEMYETLFPQKSESKYELTYKKCMDWT